MKNQKIIVRISERNLAELNSRYNSTEVDIWVDGELQTDYRIGGTSYKKAELVGNLYEGFDAGLGFVQIKDIGKKLATPIGCDKNFVRA